MSEHKTSFLKKYVFATDHKIIALQYMFTSLFALLIGFFFVLIMRWELAFPMHPIPLLGRILSAKLAPNGVMSPELYNMLGAMHGTAMIFLGIAPLGFAAFGNYVLPLQVGAPDMAFPKLNMLSYWSFVIGCLILTSSFFLPSGPLQSGWTAYPPLSEITRGTTIWILAMVFIINSSLLGAINFIVTGLNMRAPGLTLGRLPIFVWAQLVTSAIVLLAFPPVEAGAVLLLMDCVAHTSFYLPQGLTILGHASGAAGGGQPILWQHLFWFLGHPEVYVLLLPAIGIIAEIIANNSRKPLYGYKAMVGSLLTILILSFIVWAHHLYISGMSPFLSDFFAITTLAISVPSVILLTCLVFSLQGGSIRFTVPMLFALSFLPLFGIGGLTGIPLGVTVTDIYLHDTYYVIGHFHYVVVAGILMALFGGIYFWFPKWFGRKMDETLGKIHFWGTVIGINGTFFPMFILGLAGQSRRLWNPLAQAHNVPWQKWHVVSSVFAGILLLAQIPFIYNFFHSIFKGERVSDNPWEATTLDWACPSPPPHGNFVNPVSVYRGPYEYSQPNNREGWAAQNAAELV